jgi:hypothetical protein
VRLRASTFIAECCKASNCNQRLTLPPSASSAAEMQIDSASQADLVDSPARNSCAAACLRRRSRMQCRSQSWIGALVRLRASTFIAECCNAQNCNHRLTLPPSASSAAEMQSDGASQADLVARPARNSCAAARLRRRNRMQCRSQP